MLIQAVLLTLHGVRNLKYPYCLLKELDIPFSAVVDRDFLTDYINSEKEKSRDNQGFYVYKNELSTINSILPILFPDDAAKETINSALKGNYSQLFELMEKKNIFVMKYCLELDLIESSAIRNKYYDLLHISEEKQTEKTLLTENFKAIKEARNLIPAFMNIKPKDYPHSIKKIRRHLLEKINDSISC